MSRRIQTDRTSKDIRAQPKTGERAHDAQDKGELRGERVCAGFSAAFCLVPRSRSDGRSAGARSALSLIPGVPLHYAPCRLN